MCQIQTVSSTMSTSTLTISPLCSQYAIFLHLLHSLFVSTGLYQALCLHIYFYQLIFQDYFDRKHILFHGYCRGGARSPDPTLTLCCHFFILSHEDSHLRYLSTVAYSYKWYYVLCNFVIWFSFKVLYLVNKTYSNAF